MNQYSPRFRDTAINFFDTPKSYFFIEDCIVDFKTGLVYKDNDIYWETTNENMAWEPHWITRDVRWANRITRQTLIADRMSQIKQYLEEKIRKVENIPNHIDGTVLHLLHPFGHYAYGHLYDTLQKLSIIEREKLNFDSVLLSRHHGIVDFETHLKATGLTNRTPIPDESGLVQIKRLLFVMPVSHPTTFTPESYEYCRKKYYEYFSIQKDTTPTLKIFLTRRPGIRRALLNNEKIEKTLKNAGILFMDGSESLATIVKNFSKASHIAGVHGSLFTNNIFGHAATRYLEYCPRSRPDFNFKNQTKLCESYKHVLIDDVSHDISLDIEDLMKFYAS
jgi:capsular polysaccharide biosynthesis protein